MSGATKRNTISAVPFQFVYLLYCVLFGIIIKEAGVSATMTLGVMAFLGGLGLLGLDDFELRDVPLAIGGLYLVGVMVGLMLFSVVTSLPLVTAAVLGGLFLAGVVGNIFYFLGENQKLSYLNGQISEDGLTLRKVEKLFPLWLVVVGNILLVFLITPLLWGSLYNVVGSFLFEVKAEPTLTVWFVFVMENLNQSMLGVASLLGLSLPEEAVVPSGIFGRALIAVFRLGILSLGLGAIKRYLDLRATTRRLMLALGRSGLEQEQWECRNEGKRNLSDKEAQEFENRRKMWQLRLRQLIQLYPAQLDRLIAEVTGRGDWQLRMEARLPVSKDDPLQADHLGDWVRSELADLLSQAALYEGQPAERQAVIRSLLQRMRPVEDQAEFSPRLRRRVSVSLARLIRPSDPDNVKERVMEMSKALIERSDEQLDQPELGGWLRLLEARARLGATYAVLSIGQRDRIIELLPAFQRQGSTLAVDVHLYIEALMEEWNVHEATILSAAERLLTIDEGETAAAFFTEMSHALRQVDIEVRPTYQLFVAKTLVLYWYLVMVHDEELLQPTARLLLLSGEKNAAQSSWRIVQTLPEIQWRQDLLQLLVDGGLALVLGSFFRHKLGSTWSREQALAADLLTALPIDAKNSLALQQMAAHSRVAEDVRWRSLCSLATLRQASDLFFLQNLHFSETTQTRLWAAWTYAKSCCGEAEALPLLLDTLIQEPADSPAYLAVQEVLADRRPNEVESVCTALNEEAEVEERLEACENIVNKQSPLALLILERLIRNPETPKKVRQSAAEDLGILGRSMHAEQLGLMSQTKTPAEWACEPLLEALEDDKDKLVRIRAARALGRLGLPEIRQRFQKALVDPTENAVVRQVVAQAVGEMGDTSWMDFLFERFPVEKSAQVRQGMITALDQLGAEADFFLGCLSESNSKVLQLSLQALSIRRLEEAQKEAIVPLLDGSHKDVRAAAAEALGAQYYEPALTRFCDMVHHESESEKNVRRAAIRALRKVTRSKEQRAEVRLHLEQVFREDPDHLVVQDCAVAMSDLFGEETAGLLLDALKRREDHEPWMKGFAGIVRALGSCADEEAQDYLFDQLRKLLKAETLNIARLNALLRPVGAAGGSRALPVLFELVQKNSDAFSWVAAQVMADIGDPQIVKPLKKFMKYKRSIQDLEPNLEAVLLVTLVRMGEWEYLEELVALLRDTSSEREVARRRALNVLPELQMDLSSLLLTMAMSPQHTPHEKIRETAVKAMGRLTAKVEHHMQVLQWQAQADPRAKIRDAAQQALQSIEGRMSRNLRKMREREMFDVKSYLGWSSQPVHPVWQEQWDRRIKDTEHVDLKFLIPGEEDLMEPIQPTEPIAEPTADEPAEAVEAVTETAQSVTVSETAWQPEVAETSVVSNVEGAAAEVADAAAALDQTEQETVLNNVAASSVSEEEALLTSIFSPEPVVKEAPVEEPPAPPTFAEQLAESIANNDVDTFRTLVQSQDADPQRHLWDEMLSLLDDAQELQQQFGSDWFLVNGDNEGPAIYWPFLVMRNPVTKKAYADFCEATERPLPRKWKMNASEENESATNIKWFDAAAFASHNGLELPTHEQLTLTFGNYDLFGVDGKRIGWMIFPQMQEWTSTPNESRRQLIRVFSTNDQVAQHLHRDTQSFEISFRCSFSVDSRKHPVVSLILESGELHTGSMLSFVADRLGLALPEDEGEWATFIENLTAEQLSAAAESVADDASAMAPKTLPTPKVKSQETVVLHDTPVEAVTVKSTRKVDDVSAEEQERINERARQLQAEEEAQRAETERAAEEARQAKEARQAAEAEAARLATEEQQRTTQTSVFWGYLQDGQWSQASEWLQRQGEEHFEGAELSAHALQDLCRWLEEQAGMIWVREHDKEEAERIMLLRERYVSRKEFHRFCRENELPMSPRWRGGERVSSPKNPATDVSVLAAREFASSVDAKLPSVEDLENVLPYDFFERTRHELTNTHYTNNARLYYSFDLTAAHQNKPSRKTLRRDEPAAQAGFRVCRTTTVDELPVLLQEMAPHLPSAFPVDDFPSLLGPALRVFFSHRMDPRS